MAALALAAESNVELIILRPFHVFGEGQHESNFWPSLKAAARSGEDFSMTLGEQVRDFVPVETVAASFVSALTRTDLKPGQPKIENLGTGQPQTLRAFAEHWWSEWRAKGRLLPGVLPYRDNEVMRYVPLIPSAP
jgi:nucleoside-diphosphate-sugar epimerase